MGPGKSLVLHFKNCKGRLVRTNEMMIGVQLQVRMKLSHYEIHHWFKRLSRVSHKLETILKQQPALTQDKDKNDRFAVVGRTILPVSLFSPFYCRTYSNRTELIYLECTAERSSHKR